MEAESYSQIGSGTTVPVGREEANLLSENQCPTRTARSDGTPKRCSLDSLLYLPTL